MRVIAEAGVWAEPDGTGASYVEHLATASLSVGTYSIRAGASDPQSPHGEDEVYVVTAGAAQFTGGGTTTHVSAGAVLFVPAGEQHRFHDVTETLSLLVFFAPAYGSAG